MAKAQKGDLIRILPREDNNYLGIYYEIGDIFEVTERVDEEGVDIVVDKVALYVYDYEYEIHRKAGEEDDALAYYQSEVVGNEDDRISEPQDAVNSPNHYTQGRFETIEIIEEITQGYSDGYVAYCVGNALKYLARAPFKHGEPSEDISKAAKYLSFALERLQTQK